LLHVRLVLALWIGLVTVLPAEAQRPTRLHVEAGAQMQAAIDGIACGGIITIQNDLVLPPHLRLRNQDITNGAPCTTDTIIRREGPLPGPYDVLTNCYLEKPAGTPDDLAFFKLAMAKRDACWEAQRIHYGTGAPKFQVETLNAQQGNAIAIQSDCGASHWRFQGVEIRSVSTVVDPPVYALVFLGGTCNGWGNGTFKTDAEIGHDITFEQVWFHGLTTPIRTAPTVASSTRRGILGHANRLTIKDSLMDDFAEIGQDSQCLMVYNARGPFTIDNVFCDAAGENVLFGGADPSIVGLAPSDITITRSYFTKNWNRWQRGSLVGYTDSAYNWQSKNSLECKNCARLTLRQSIIEASWAYNQNGNLSLFQSVSDGGTCTWCSVREIDLQDSVFRYGASMMDLAGYAGQNGGASMGGPVEVAYNVAYGLWRIFGPSETAGGTPFSLISGSQNTPTKAPLRGVRIHHNTIENEGQIAVIGNCGDLFAGFELHSNIVKATQPWYDAQVVFCGLGSQSGFDTYMPNPGGRTVHSNVIATDGIHLPWAEPNHWIPLADYAGLFETTGRGYQVKAGSPYVGLGADLARLPGGGQPIPLPPMPEPTPEPVPIPPPAPKVCTDGGVTYPAGGLVIHRTTRRNEATLIASMTERAWAWEVSSKVQKNTVDVTFRCVGQ
jgi:hypothetical protein